MQGGPNSTVGTGIKGSAESHGATDKSTEKQKLRQWVRKQGQAMRQAVPVGAELTG